MKAILLSIALLGAGDDWFENHMERANLRKIAESRDTTQREIADQDRTNTYIIGGAIVAGLVLFGLLARGGKKTT